MSNFNDEEAQSIVDFTKELFREAVSVKQKELGRDLTEQELQEISNKILMEVFGQS